MSQKEKKWRRIYLALLIFIYCLYIPVEVYEFIQEDKMFPIAVIVVGLAFPVMRYNHLKKIRAEEAS